MPRQPSSRVIAKLKEKHGSDAIVWLYGTPLCNFSNHSFVIDGKRIPTVEHGFQSMKTLDERERAKIIAAHTPALAKRLGRRARLRDDWDSKREEVMRECLEAKFTQNADAREYLLRTSLRPIIEVRIILMRSRDA